ncbi:pilus assembly protein [Aromatoleum toluvorans]|uniref:Pilus assembly protein n=1 Tax=Aromatoleum toluvorans TaxID=92002 RepID=A0ABX1PXW0_9RHOO|nr:TadE/TadG family type IV pilus assembly protein [Aromatoleum toluvorans]NMG43074.1 pilus assembly protein [Aromatoleum toluvorans]
MNGRNLHCCPAGQRQTGVAAVELAFVIFFLLLLVAGIIEFGRAFWYYDALTKATRDGARLLSIAERADFTSHIGTAQTRVMNLGNAANLRPPLTESNVAVTCMNKDFGAIGCGNGTSAPENIRVAISGYAIDIGGLFPFILPGTATVFGGIPLAPHTTMPYMK